MMLPKDPVILLSYINTLLRDQYPSLEELCAAMEIDEAGLRDTLRTIRYEYEPQQNQFI